MLPVKSHLILQRLTIYCVLCCQVQRSYRSHYTPDQLDKLVSLKMIDDTCRAAYDLTLKKLRQLNSTSAQKTRSRLNAEYDELSAYIAQQQNALLPTIHQDTRETVEKVRLMEIQLKTMAGQVSEFHTTQVKHELVGDKAAMSGMGLRDYVRDTNANLTKMKELAAARSAEEKYTRLIRAATIASFRADVHPASSSAAPQASSSAAPQALQTQLPLKVLNAIPITPPGGPTSPNMFESNFTNTNTRRTSLNFTIERMGETCTKT